MVGEPVGDDLELLQDEEDAPLDEDLLVGVQLSVQCLQVPHLCLNHSMCNR